MTAPRHAPVASFAPELLSALLRARGETFTIDFPTSALAKKFQMRLHTLRRAMVREKVDHADEVWRVSVSVQGNSVVLGPRDEALVASMKIREKEGDEPPSALPFDPIEAALGRKTGV